MIIIFEEKARFVSFHPKSLKYGSFESQGLGICELEETLIKKRDLDTYNYNLQIKQFITY